MRRLVGSRLVRLGLLASLGAAMGAAAAGAAGPYRGKVVDAQTKEPIADAVVLIYWNREAPGLGHGPSEAFLDADEALANERGEFTVGANPPRTWVPGTWVSRPHLTIFSPGYGYFPMHVSTDVPVRSSGDDELFKDMERRLVVFELPRLASREERLRALATVNPLVVPRSRMPEFIKLLNLERQNLNLPPLYREK